MVTLQIFVRSEEDGPLGPTPLDTYLLYYLLWDLSSCFLLLGHIIIKEWDFKPSAKAQVLAPITTYVILEMFKYLTILSQINCLCIFGTNCNL